jgi:hypothetical protein
MTEFFRCSKEKFLIVDVSSRGASALFLNFNEQRELVFEKIIKNIDFKKFLTSQARSIFQRSWEGKYFFNSRRKLVVLAGADLTTTIPVPLDFKRDVSIADEPITISEAEDWFARATAKIFAGCRLEAARRLGTGDIDTVLVNQRIDRMVIDGRVVADPIGRSGKKVSFIIELTFAARELSESLAPFFNAPGEFFFAEAPQAQLAALARIKPLPLNIIAVRDGGKSSLFIFQEAEQGCSVVYRESFSWDASMAVRGIAQSFAVSFSSAEEIYGMYVRGEVSDAAKKYFDALVAPSAERFFGALDKANIHGLTYLDAPRDISLKTPYHRHHVTIENVPVASLLEKFGFSSDDAALMSPRIVLRYLAPFFELYFDNNRSELNELLKRKLHWLA